MRDAGNFWKMKRESKVVAEEKGKEDAKPRVSVDGSARKG